MADSDYGVSGSSTPGSSTSEVETPAPYSTQSRTTLGKQTSWRSQAGVLSKQNFGSFIKFDDDNSGPSVPAPDKGMGRN